MTSKYIVIIEIDRKGLIAKELSSFGRAKEYLEGIFKIADQYNIEEMYKIESRIDYLETYSINGTELYFGKSVYSCSNGVLSVYILEKTKEFNINLFIKERENYSSTIGSESDSQSFEKLLEKFPNLSVGSN